jgi:hypothetical protein
MIQQGQLFKLKTKGAAGQPLWAYRYRLEGRDSERPQAGATQALRQVLNRAVALGPLDYNPAKLGVPNPARRTKEKRPFQS